MRSNGNSSGLVARLKEDPPRDGPGHKQNKTANHDDGRFVQVPMSIILHPRLSDGARVLYALLLSYDWQDGDGRRKGRTWPSLARLAEQSGKSTRQVTRYLRELEEEGVIRTEHGGEHRATRRLLVRAGGEQ
jgi:AraC-like DNA-binding protein